MKFVLFIRVMYDYTFKEVALFLSLMPPPRLSFLSVCLRLRIFSALLLLLFFIPSLLLLLPSFSHSLHLTVTVFTPPYSPTILSKKDLTVFVCLTRRRERGRK